MISVIIKVLIAIVGAIVLIPALLLIAIALFSGVGDDYDPYIEMIKEDKYRSDENDK